MKLGLLLVSKGNLGDSTRNQKFYEILQDLGLDIAVVGPLSSDVAADGKMEASRTYQILSRFERMISKTPFAQTSLFQRCRYELLTGIRSRVALDIVQREKVVMLQAEAHLAADIALFLRKRLGIPYIFDIHGLSSVEEYAAVHNPSDRFLCFLRAKEVETMRNAEEIFVVSNAMKEFLESSYGLRNISVVPNGSDPYPGLRKTHNVPLNVIYAGAFAHFERVNDYLDAVKIAASEDYRFYLVGDGHLKTPILNRLKEEDLPVKYLGSLSRDALRESLKKMHVGIAPRAKDDCQRFNFSVKTLEYLSMGMPVVCADIDESSQIVGQHDCGTLVPPEDPEAIAEALRLYKDERLWTRHSQNGIKLIENEFSWKNIIGSVKHVYEKYAG